MTATAVINAKDNTGGVLGSIARRIDQLTRSTSRFSKASAVLTAGSRGGAGGLAGAGALALLGRASPYLAPLAVGAAGAKAFTQFAETERRMTRLGLTAGASREEMAAVTAEAQKMASQVALPFEDVVGGFESLAAQGRKLSEIRAFMPSVAATAQAAGAEVRDIAEAAGAVGDNMGIAAEKMQAAFDIMIAGGKAGKFELKDMARYLPSLAPAAAAIGLQGETGLQRLITTLQIVRNQTGTVEEAASSVNNIFSKMESEETAKRFKKFGVDLRGEMDKARKSGKDLLTTFVDLAQKATRGDLSKIPQLFSDMEFARGMRALLSQRPEFERMLNALKHVDGSSFKDLNQVLKDSQSRLTRLGAEWDRFMTNTGKLISVPATPALDWLNAHMEELQRIIDGAPKIQAPISPEAVRQTTQSLRTARDEEIAQLDADIAALEAEIATIKARNKLPDMLDFALGNRPGRLADLKNRRAGAGYGAANDLASFEALEAQIQDLEKRIAASQRRIAAVNAAGGRTEFGVNDLAPVQGSFLGGTPRSPWLGQNPTGLPSLNYRQAPGTAPLPPRREDNITPMLQRLEDVLGPGKLEAVVTQPVDVTGKLDPVELQGAATVTVKVITDQGSRVGAMSAESSGHIRANVGTSMPHIKAGLR